MITNVCQHEILSPSILQVNWKTNSWVQFESTTKSIPLLTKHNFPHLWTWFSMYQSLTDLFFGNLSLHSPSFHSKAWGILFMKNWLQTGKRDRPLCIWMVIDQLACLILGIQSCLNLIKDFSRPTLRNPNQKYQEDTIGGNTKKLQNAMLILPPHSD